MELKSITFPGLDEPYKTAPGGYGYGEGLIGLGSTNDDAAFTAKLSEQFAKTANRTRQFYFTHGGGAFLGTLWNAGNNYGVLVATSYAEPNVGFRFKQMVRVCTNGTWGAWVDNSPTAFAPASHTHDNMKLLWENASTASEFAGQTISLNLSDYDVVVITASNDTSEIIPVGKSGAITTWNGYYISKRTVNVSTSGVQFSAVTKWTEYGTNKQSETVDNSQAKPNRIYGIKGVS